MKCPECGVWTVVKEVRPSTVHGYRRRRECANGHKFTTVETVVPQEVMELELKTRNRNVKKLPLNLIDSLKGQEI